MHHEVAAHKQLAERSRSCTAFVFPSRKKASAESRIEALGPAFHGEWDTPRRHDDPGRRRRRRVHHQWA